MRREKFNLKNPLERAKYDAIKAAGELYYPQLVIEKIKAAKNEVEITNIMKTARKK